MYQSLIYYKKYIEYNQPYPLTITKKTPTISTLSRLLPYFHKM